MMRMIWFLAIAATLWFALIPPDWGGLGGTGYHGAAFLVLSVCTPAAFVHAPLIRVWIVLVALGGGIELAQGFTGQGRHGEWDDFAVDTLATSFGIIAYRIWSVIYGRSSDDDLAEEEQSQKKLTSHELK